MSLQKETKNEIPITVEEIKAALRRFEAVRYLLAVEAERRGGELIIETDCSDNFSDVGFHIEMEEGKMRLRVKIGEKPTELH